MRRIVSHLEIDMPVAKAPAKPSFYLDDVQDYYNVLLIGGIETKVAERRTKQKFDLKGMDVNPIGRITGVTPPVDRRPTSSTALEIQGGDIGPLPPEDDALPPESGAQGPTTTPAEKTPPKAKAEPAAPKESVEVRLIRPGFAAAYVGDTKVAALSLKEGVITSSAHPLYTPILSRLLNMARMDEADYGSKNVKGVWYHGDQHKRDNFKDQKWDRERFTKDPNAQGPGLYLTQLFSEAVGYAYPKGYVYTIKLKTGFKALTMKAKPDRATLEKFIELAPDDSRQIGYENWNGANAVDQYMKSSDTMFDALMSLHHDFYQSRPQPYIDAMKQLGYHGLLVPNQGVKHAAHLVVFDPSMITTDKEQAYDDAKKTMDESVDLQEVSPPGFSGTVAKMKEKHPEIKNPYALAWGMYKKGAKPHVKKEKGKPNYKDPKDYFDKRKKAKAALKEHDLSDAVIATILEDIDVSDIITDAASLYARWNHLVNMTADEVLESIHEGVDKKDRTDQGRATAQMIKRMQTTEQDQWTAPMWEWAKKHIGMITSLSGGEGVTVNESRHKMLCALGHDSRRTPRPFHLGSRETAAHLDEEQLDEVVAGVRDFLDGTNQVIHLGKAGWFDVYSVIKMVQPDPLIGVAYQLENNKEAYTKLLKTAHELNDYVAKSKELTDLQMTGAKENGKDGFVAAYGKVDKMFLIDRNADNWDVLKKTYEKTTELLSDFGFKKQSRVVVITDLSKMNNSTSGSKGEGSVGGYWHRKLHIIAIDSKAARTPNAVAILLHEWAHAYQDELTKSDKEAWKKLYDQTVVGSENDKKLDDVRHNNYINTLVSLVMSSKATKDVIRKWSSLSQADRDAIIKKQFTPRDAGGEGKTIWYGNVMYAAVTTAAEDMTAAIQNAGGSKLTSVQPIPMAQFDTILEKWRNNLTAGKAPKAALIAAIKPYVPRTLKVDTAQGALMAPLRDAMHDAGVTPSSYAGANWQELWAETAAYAALKGKLSAKLRQELINVIGGA